MGVACALLSALGWAISGVAGKRMTANVPPMTIVAGRALLGGMLLLPLVVFGEHKAYQASGWTWGWMAVAVAITMASYTLYYRGLAKTTVSNAAMLETFQPVVTLGVGVLLGRPGMTGWQLAGAGLVLAGAVMVSAQELLLRRKAEAVIK